MANLSTALSKMVKEELAPTIKEMRIKLDPIWQDIFVSSMGVTSEGLGRDWTFKFPCVSGLGGAYRFEPNTFPSGPSMAAEGDDYGILPAPNSFPGRLEATVPAWFDITLKLKEARGNIFLPLKWMQVDSWNATIGSAIRKVMQGTGRRIALSHAISFFTKDNTRFTLMQLSDSASAAAHNYTVDNTVDTSAAAAGNLANGRIQMLHPGLMVDIWDATGVTRRNGATDPWVVTRVNWAENKFRIASTTAASVAVTDTDILVLRRSATASQTQGQQPSGLNSWIRSVADSSTTIYQGNLDVALHPEYASIKVANLGGPLTEKVLNKYVGAYLERIGTMCDIDTLMMSAGVTHAYLENEDNLARYERNGRRLSVKAGWADIDYGYQGKPFRWAISSFVEPKAVYGIKTGEGNIKELVPPRTPGTGSESTEGFDNEIQFIAQLGGANKIWLHETVTAGSGNNEYGDQYQAPFYRICELYAENPQSLVIRGVEESNAS